MKPFDEPGPSLPVASAFAEAGRRNPHDETRAVPACGAHHPDLVHSINEVLRIAATLGLTTALPAVLTVDQAADVLNVNRKTVYVAIQKREIPGVRRLGKSLRISTEALLAWMHKGRGGAPSK